MFGNLLGVHPYTSWYAPHVTCNFRFGNLPSSCGCMLRCVSVYLRCVSEHQRNCCVFLYIFSTCVVCHAEKSQTCASRITSIGRSDQWEIGLPSQKPVNPSEMPCAVHASDGNVERQQDCFRSQTLTCDVARPLPVITNCPVSRNSGYGKLGTGFFCLFVFCLLLQNLYGKQIISWLQCFWEPLPFWTHRLWAFLGEHLITEN